MLLEFFRVLAHLNNLNMSLVGIKVLGSLFYVFSGFLIGAQEKIVLTCK